MTKREALDGLRVKPAAELARRDPGRSGLDDKAQARRRGDARPPGRLHDRLWAEAQQPPPRPQGMDAPGRTDHPAGAHGVEPTGRRWRTGPRTTSTSHDYLWRARAPPARGILGVWNRTTDVVAARVVGAIDDEQCRRRFRHIREFERMLCEEGSVVLKVFLHISKDEQRDRLQARVDDPRKNWKFRRADLDVRAQWDAYHARYDEAITETSTDWSPWHVVPADHKWVRDVAVASLLVDVLERLDPKIPDPEPGLTGLIVG
jgi:polyphosphate kinase 2 (PPK2 family)